MEAADGEEALDLVATSGTPPDLIITDLVMPVMNGRMLADRIRTDHPDIRVLFMSGYAEDAESEGMPPDVEGFLGKPFTSDELLDAVSRALSHPRSA